MEPAGRDDRRAAPRGRARRSRLATTVRTIDWVAGIGWGGQRLYVVPSLDLVVAVTASNDTFGARQYLAGSTALDIVLRAATNH